MHAKMSTERKVIAAVQSSIEAIGEIECIKVVYKQLSWQSCLKAKRTTRKYFIWPFCALFIRHEETQEQPEMLHVCAESTPGNI